MHSVLGGDLTIPLRLPLVLGLAAAVACHDGATSPEIDVEAYLTPEVRAQLNEHGQILIPNVSTGSSFISADEARTLATAFCRQAGHFYRYSLEERYGSSIDFSSLRADERVYFAETPYGAVPPDAHVSFRKLYGPYYLVTMTARNGDPVLSVAVSAYNTDLTLENGKVKFPRDRGNDFFIVAYDKRTDLTLPLLPEKAVGRVANAVRRRVNGVNLILRDVRMSPQTAMWRIGLEEAATVRAGGKLVNATEIFVDPRGNLYAASPNQTDAVQMHYLSASNPGETKRGAVPIRSAYALTYEPISN